MLRLQTEKKATITIMNCYAPNSVVSEEDKGNFCLEFEANHEELVKGLTSCAKAAMKSHRLKDERMNPKAKQLLRHRGEIKRDPTTTHPEKITINKACREVSQRIP
ncbi:hypothetical protein ANCDUO_19911 [Ancylostoma duodenale]|uniref:Uncharacterized protein n=1 Tax=Ancylostoma duodenale TaxID=51022 RepID=A0A0C2C185_9BILA|nr:hypothetical protein ANCDUO_19911 [Ancylostoma duodenale]